VNLPQIPLYDFVHDLWFDSFDLKRDVKWGGNYGLVIMGWKSRWLILISGIIRYLLLSDTSGRLHRNPKDGDSEVDLSQPFTLAPLIYLTLRLHMGLVVLTLNSNSIAISVTTFSLSCKLGNLWI